MTALARHIAVSIECPADRLYDFVSNPENLPDWAAGLADSISEVNGTWTVESPMGRVTIEFAERNPYGVLDHDVTLPSGERVTNPMRVVPNGDGSEVSFTLFRRPGMSDRAFADDARAVGNDLESLKALLES